MERVHLAEGTSGKADLAFHSRFTTPPTIRCFANCSSRCAKASSGSGRSLSTDPILPPAPFRSTALCSTPSLPGDAEGARAETLKILAIVEEDIKEMSQ